jgi:hypothetical protein
MSDDISIKGLDHADVLAALYNASQPLGMGMFHFEAKPMTHDEAAELLKTGNVGESACRPPDDRGVYFDYLKGRVMKVNIGGDTLNPRLYDRDNGNGAAARAIAPLRKVTP